MSDINLCKWEMIVLDEKYGFGRILGVMEIYWNSKAILPSVLN